MSDIDKINKRFFIVLISFIFILLAAIAILIIASLLIQDEDMRYLAYFGVLISMLFITPPFKSRLEQIINISYIIKIRKNQAKPLPLNHLKNLDNLRVLLINDGYVKYAVDQAHALYYKTNKGSTKKIIRRYLLEIVVVIQENQNSFYLDAVDEEIHKIQQELLKENKKIDKMLITQIKEIKNLDENTLESIKEIVFFKTKVGIISTINIGCYQPDQLAFMLYSESYAPSIYYKRHIEQIKKLI
ncbi:MAG TPA: hypothetical protein DHV05_08010 [Acholeplasmataceae bacterium]|nr:hypothetical protein [Acholeplasmataceae bacterium]